MKADLTFSDPSLEAEFSKLQAARSRDVGKQVGLPGLGAASSRGTAVHCSAGIMPVASAHTPASAPALHLTHSST